MLPKKTEEKFIYACILTEFLIYPHLIYIPTQVLSA